MTLLPLLEVPCAGILPPYAIFTNSSASVPHRSAVTTAYQQILVTWAIQLPGTEADAFANDYEPSIPPIQGHPQVVISPFTPEVYSLLFYRRRWNGSLPRRKRRPCGGHNAAKCRITADV